MICLFFKTIRGQEYIKAHTVSFSMKFDLYCSVLVGLRNIFEPYLISKITSVTMEQKYDIINHNHFCKAYIIVMQKRKLPKLNEFPENLRCSNINGAMHKLLVGECLTGAKSVR